MFIRGTWLANQAEETESIPHWLDWSTSAFSKSAADLWMVVSAGQVQICQDKYRLELQLKFRNLKENLTFGTLRPTVLVIGEGEKPQDQGRDPTLRNRQIYLEFIQPVRDGSKFYDSLDSLKLTLNFSLQKEMKVLDILALLLFGICTEMHIVEKAATTSVQSLSIRIT